MKFILNAAVGLTMFMKLGYACINLSLPCTCSRTFRLGSFNKERFLESARSNLECLIEILKWNKAHHIYFFRISSGLIPFADHPICKIKWQKIFRKDFERIGEYIRKNKMRVSMHPDHFTVLNSPRKEIVKKSVKNLEYHNDVLDLLTLDSTHKIQIHIGGVYREKEESKARFAENYKKLPARIKQRLVLENDDRSFSLKDCLVISQKTGIPVLFDVFHHSLLNNKETIKQAALAASKTWKNQDGIFMLDFSSQAKNKKKGAHADYIDKQDFENFLQTTKSIKKDIMLEAKSKNKALLKLNL